MQRLNLVYPQKILTLKGKNDLRGKNRLFAYAVSYFFVVLE